MEFENSTKLYKKRWFILFLYVMYGAANGTQWVQYCIITNIIQKYYNVSSYIVDWTSLITMVTYPPLLLPATYIIDKWGLRITAILGVFGTATGNWIKVFSTNPNYFWVTFLGQTVLSLVQPLILSVPPKLASTWFSEKEVSRACGIGVFGQQFGTAIGFILPPLIVKNHDDLNLIGKELWYLFLSCAIFTTLIGILVLIFFKERPDFPPSNAQLLLREQLNDSHFIDQFKSYKTLFLNKPFMVHAICYGMNIGVFVGFCTILNQLILSYFENGEEDAGLIGLLMIIVGMAGSVIFGIILDKTRKYKQITVVVYFMCGISLIMFMFALETYSKIFVYLSGIAIGLFMNSYYSVGLELAVEFSYPLPEATSSGILIGADQTVGTILVLTSGLVLKSVNPFWTMAILAAVSFIGAFVTSLMPNITKRQEAFANTKNFNFVAVPTS